MTKGVVLWCSQKQLVDAAEAAERLMKAMRGLASEGHTVPGLLVGAAVMRPWEHYPSDDAWDRGSGYRYYYHAHPRQPRAEHGHFHVFHQASSQTVPTHLIGVAVGARGLPLRLFATNRWVTDELLQPAPQVLASLSRFRMTEPLLLKPVHIWLRALLAVFAPQIRELLRERDERIGAGRPRLLEDRRIGVLSERRVSLTRQVKIIHRLLKPVTAVSLPEKN